MVRSADVVRSLNRVVVGTMMEAEYLRMMMTFRAMYVRGRLRRWSQLLSRQQDAAGLMLLDQMCSYFGMVCSDIPEHAV